jgi:hypothetical protein
MTAYSCIYTSVTYVQAKTGLSNTEVDLTNDNIVRMTIEDAENEVNMLTGRKYITSTAVTEYFDGPKTDSVGYTGDKAASITLNNYPILSITECKVLDADGDVNTTYDTLTTAEISAGTFYSADYRLHTMEDPLTGGMVCYGKLSLISDEFPTGIQNVKVAYTYGYASVPVPIRDLATCLAGIRCWIRFMGGCYNRLNSYSVPEQSVNKGDFYDRGMKNIQLLTDEAEKLLERIGRKARTLFYATGEDR